MPVRRRRLLASRRGDRWGGRAVQRILLQFARLLSPMHVLAFVVLVGVVQWHPRRDAAADAVGAGVAASQAASRPAAARPPPRMSDPLPALRSAAPMSEAAAARMLAQATFGPTLADIANLRELGYARWLDEQFAAPASYQLPYLDAVPFGQGYEGQRLRMEAWLLHAVGGPDPFRPAFVHRDQLRQRVAFALSEIFVVSDQHDFLFPQPYAMASYYDMLVRNSFGNFRQLLEEVTLHPAMGLYLSMLGNRKPDAGLNIRPDENFAREVLQLFSVGLVRLNRDGTPMLDELGRTIPTYGQFTVKGFAHVFTGWSFAGCGHYPSCWYNDFSAPAWRASMVPYPAYHASAGSKQLLAYPGVALQGGVLGPGGTPESDLDAALDNIFNHPNVGPFIARQLIQRLVTSNPGGDYIARVAAKFDDNGAGVRGDMKAVIRAILLDREALRPDVDHFGKVREPIVRMVNLWRALDARTDNGRIEVWDPQAYLGQAPLRAPSVFNFFSPAYTPIGELSELGLAAPELQLATGFRLPIANDALGDLVFLNYVRGPQSGGDVVLDLDRDAPLAADPDALLDRYDLLFFSGRMTSRTRQILRDHLVATPNRDGGRDRVREALYLIVNSPEYIVQK